MCDCYTHTCNHHGCKARLAMHLGDFDTKRSEIRVYCEKHIPHDTSAGVVWEYEEYDAPGKRRVAYIKVLTDNARRHAFINHPNEIKTRILKIWGKTPTHTQMKTAYDEGHEW